jgi:hypothetical protein
MKIHELTGQLTIALTNQEHDFVKRYGQQVMISALTEVDQELARKLVIKGVYKPSQTSNTIRLARG